MKISDIITILFGLFLIVIAIGIFQSLPTCKDDRDVVLYLFMMICSGFGSICCVLGGISDYNKSCKDEKDNSGND